MPHEEQPGKVARLCTAAFHGVELAAYVGIGVMLTCAAALALGGAALVFWQGIGDGTGTDAIFTMVDRLLFVMLLVEILHTITASVRTGTLTCEPFLVVGLIASVRRVLVITLQTSETGKGGMQQPTPPPLQDQMMELGVLAALILILVVSLFLLRRSEGFTKRGDEA